MIRIVTIACAMLTVVSAVVALVLPMVGGGQLWISGALLFALGLAVVVGAEYLAAVLRRCAARSRRRLGGAMRRMASSVLAIGSGVVPMAVLIVYQHAAFAMLCAAATGRMGVLDWLFAYGVATGPWTFMALGLRLPGIPMTLVGIHAYAGHLVFLILTLATVPWAGMHVVAPALMLLVVVPPIIVGTLIGLADPNSLPHPAIRHASRRRVAGHRTPV